MLTLQSTTRPIESTDEHDSLKVYHDLGRYLGQCGCGAIWGLTEYRDAITLWHEGHRQAARQPA